MKYGQPTGPQRWHETQLTASGHLVAGLDEVGRGALAGPVVAAAVVLGEELPAGINDSKLLTPRERERLAMAIQQTALVGIGSSPVREINAGGLSRAIRLAGWRALRNLPQTPTRVLLDGSWNYLPRSYHCQTIVKGDAHELCIAAASVVAKVHRDALMQALDRRYPGYYLGVHKGYGTAKHQQALREHGVSAIHRLTYQPVSQALQATI